MNVISSLSAVALPEIQTAAALVNLEIVEDGGLFTVYRGGHYHTSCASEAVLLEIVNQHIDQHNERIEAVQAKADQVLTLTDGVSGNATLNARERKLSRSKANLGKDAPQLRLHVLTDRVVYELDEQ